MRIVLIVLFLLLAGHAKAQPAFLVFFDWDHATLTAQGQQAIHQAAEVALRTHASVDVGGFTDTSGTPQYNQTLSWHRAETVAAELQHNGVPAAAIHVRWFGQNFLRLPTPDEIREPQNRRVAIILHVPPPPPPPPPPIVYVPVPVYPPIYPPIYPWWGYGYPGVYGYRFGWSGGHWHGWHR